MVPLRRALPPVLAVATLVAVLTVTAAGAPPPQHVCGVCGEDLEIAAEDEDIDLTVVNSSLDITVTDDGDGRWVARIAVENATALTDHSLRERIVRQTYEHGRTVVENPMNLTTALDGDTLVVRFAVRDMAHRGVGGVLVVDYFRSAPVEGSYVVAADRVTVTGPAGTAPSYVDGGATAREGSVVWRTGADGAVHLPDETYLAFAPGGGVAGKVTSLLAVTTMQASMYGPTVAVLGSLPAALLGAAALGLTRFERRVSAWAYDLDVQPQTLRLGAGALALALAVTGAVSLVAAPALRGALFALPVALFLLLGSLGESDRRLRTTVGLALVATPFLAATALVPLGPLLGLSVGWLLLVPWALGSALVGGLCYLSARESVRTPRRT
jgi:hypothetical protein